MSIRVGLRAYDANNPYQSIQSSILHAAEFIQLISSEHMKRAVVTDDGVKAHIWGSGLRSGMCNGRGPS